MQTQTQEPSPGPPSNGERRRMPFQETEIQALIKALDEATMPLTIEQEISLKGKCRTLRKRTTKVSDAEITR